MIKALLIRRYWLFKNRLVPSLILYLLLPFIIFAMIGSPLKNIIRYSSSGVPYDIWSLPGLIFILASIVIFPPVYREFFDLRMHEKSLFNIALTPHSKTKIIFSNLVVAIIETIIISILAGIIYTNFIEISVSFLNLIFFISTLILYLFLIGNLFITLLLIFDNLSTVLLSVSIIFLINIFGSGFIIETSFFPNELGGLLTLQPLSLPLQIYRTFNSIGIINLEVFLFLLPIIYLWILLNSFLLKRKMLQ